MFIKMTSVSTEMTGAYTGNLFNTTNKPKIMSAADSVQIFADLEYLQRDAYQPRLLPKDLSQRKSSGSNIA